ncbi:MAG: PleD family two-component system response regulator [Candidatus Woesearchaeota archaeon]
MKGKILIVDDYEYILSALKMMINALPSAYNFEVICSKDSKKALNLLKADNNINLILLDIMMPNIDGISMAKSIKLNPRTKNIPLVFISAKTEKDIMERARKYSEGFLKKPFEIEQIREIIDEFAFQKSNPSDLGYRCMEKITG